MWEVGSEPQFLTPFRWLPRLPWLPWLRWRVPGGLILSTGIANGEHRAPLAQACPRDGQRWPKGAQGYPKMVKGIPEPVFSDVCEAPQARCSGAHSLFGEIGNSKHTKSILFWSYDMV